MFSSVHY
jgi:hypothetical protein